MRPDIQTIEDYEFYGFDANTRGKPHSSLWDLFVAVCVVRGWRGWLNSFSVRYEGELLGIWDLQILVKNHPQKPKDL